MTIEHLIRSHSISAPHMTALIQGDATVSYEELWAEIESAASWFTERTALGDRVVLSASKDIKFVSTYFGAHLAGLIAVPIDPESSENRLNRIIETAGPTLILGELRNRGVHEVIPFADVRTDSKGALQMPNDDDVADIMFTTGTTGLPKGVALTFKNQLAAANNINSFIQNSSSDVELLALPISHSFGLGRMRCVLSVGATLVMLGSFASMKKFYGEVERCDVTGFGMVPAGWSYIRKMSGDRLGQFANQLRYIEIGSAFMSIDDKRKLMSLLPLTRICMHYGLTEASRSTFLSFHDDINNLETAGKASPNTEVAVFSEAGRRLGVNEDGEIAVKGEHVCSAYWGQPEQEYRKDFVEGFFRTGDWGHIDEDGFLHLISRKKEIINVGGKKVSPLEVEEVLNSFEGVEESACIGVNDDVLGEVVKAFCVCSAEVDFNTLKKMMMKKIEGYKIPVYFEVIDELPKTQNGKLQRLALRK